MLRIPGTILDFANAAPLASDTSAPLAYPSVREGIESRHIIVSADPGPATQAAHIQVPVSSWDQLPEYLQVAVEKTPKLAAKFAKAHLENVAEAADVLRASHREIIDEYMRLGNSISEDDWVRLFQKNSLRYKEAAALVLKEKLIQSVKVHVMPKRLFDQLMQEHSRIAMMPDGPGRDRMLREATRRLVFSPEITLRQTYEVTSQAAEKLKSITWAFFLVQWIGPSADLLTARTYGQFKDAVNAVAKTVGTWAGGAAGAWTAPAVFLLAGVANLTPAGWLITGLALSGGVAGGVLGGAAFEEGARRWLPDLDRDLTLD